MLTVVSISFLVCIIALIATTVGAFILLLDEKKDFLNATADEVVHWVVIIGMVVIAVSWLTAFVLGCIVFF